MWHVFDNFPVKLASLALATLLWFVIAGEKSSERGVAAPVELQNFPKDLELTGDLESSIEVRLRASPSIIQQLGPGQISAQIDLKGATEGEHIVHLTESAIRVPFGVTVVRIKPAIIVLNFERTLVKAVPVRPRIAGHAAPGYELDKVDASPPQVNIAGPKSRVLAVESAFTEPVSIEGAARTVSALVNLGLDSPVLRIQGEPQVTVTARIREVLDRRTFTLPLSVRDGAGQVRPASADVTLAGPASTLQRLTPADVRPYVRASGESAGPLPVAVEIAPGFSGVAVDKVVPPQASLRPASRKKEN
jgi:YbbR domain-containing protein